MINLKEAFPQIFRFSIVGLINTIVAYSIIFVLMYIGKPPELSNLIGYFVGIILSYNLNRRYTFKSKASYLRSVPMFFMAISVAYVVNFLMLEMCLYVLNINPFISQIIGGVFYTTTGFFLMKFIAFRR